MTSNRFVIILLILIFFLHTVAIINFWYWTFWWFDIVMHFLGGFWVASLFFNLNSKLNFLPNNLTINNSIIKNLTIIVLSLGFVALIAVLWEFFEFFYDVFISVKGYPWVAQQGMSDTMTDLFLGFLGGFVATIIILKKKLIRSYSG
ncbi:MAG TPA: hypothetical protein ENH26_01605 [Candidatus Wolfebacteria bacterium]|nr:hypothetical protein [Candidatus Wolfebacteria bacterium]